MRNSIFSFFSFYIFFCLIPLSIGIPVQALEPEEVMVIANKNAAKSMGLAKYYMEKRQIPKENLVTVFMTDKETCTHDAYAKKAVLPIRRFLDQHPDIRAIVTMYGIPLKISSPGEKASETKKKEQIQAAIKELENKIKTEDMSSEEKEKQDKKLLALKQNLTLFKQITNKGASFDSELMLVKKESYDLNMWMLNPFYLGFQRRSLKIKKADVLMVSRLDGADEKIVKRIIDDSLEAEKNGLKGSAYFDARWKAPKEPKKGNGYGYYDQSIHRAAQSLAKKKTINVVIDDNKSLFDKDQNLDTALYCGWYSLAKYIDAFDWQKGSVGYHIASSECTTLKNKNSQVWCKKMLDNGAAATIGPIGEPYVQAFPVPEIFFGFLTLGEMTLLESYMLSLPYLSWKMVLVGDPLYRINFKK